MATPFETPGAFSWNELIPTDPAAAKRFYGELLGWSFKDMDMGRSGVYSVVNAGGQDCAGIMACPQQAAGMPPMWGGYVTVNDVDASAKRVAELGGTVLLGPLDIPNVGRFCAIRDPQGAMISLITYLKRG